MATEATAAGGAANHQGKYWKLDTLLWEKAFKTRQFDMAHLEDLAVGAGVDVDLFRRDVKEGDTIDPRATPRRGQLDSAESGAQAQAPRVTVTSPAPRPPPPYGRH